MKKGGSVNGLTFALWDEPLSHSAPSYQYVSSNYVNADQLGLNRMYPLCLIYRERESQPPLSPEQRNFSPIWRRPRSHRNVLDSKCSDSSVHRTSADIRTTTRAQWQLLPQDILQHIVTDCSVCASMSVCLEHSRRFSSNVSATFVGYNCVCELAATRGLYGSVQSILQMLPRTTANASN